MLTAWMRAVRSVLPQGRPLPAEAWGRRHRAILWVLGLHAAGLYVFALIRGLAPAQALVAVFPLAVAAALGGYRGLSRRWRASITTLGLMGSSAVLVGLAAGQTEAHFHFFVMLFVIVLYQEWITFLLATAFVLVEHAVVGVVAPHDVYAHSAATDAPIKWAAIHALFIAGAAVAAIANWRLTETAQDRGQAAADELAHQAVHDTLTGLLNRAGFDRRLIEAIGVSSSSPRTLCLINLDRFRLISGAGRHAQGDELLRRVAGLVSDVAGEAVAVARVRGDRFAVLLPVAAEEGVAVAERVRARIADLAFQVDEQAVALTASIGVVPVTPLAVGPEELIIAAEAACYTAKERGRDRVELYRADNEALAKHQQEMDWAGRLVTALRDDRFELFYQPIARVPGAPVRNGAAQFGELLLRMRTEDGKVVPPGLFLPAAERYDLLPAVDRWVVAHAFQVLAAHYHGYGAGHPDGPLADHWAINLSGPSIGDAEFIDYVQAQLALSGLPAELICFEITESVAINDLRKAAEFISQLRDLGFRFALDDFGTGLSSFTYLKHLPVDFLKIDGAFIRNLEHDELDRVMTRTINDLGHQMGLCTVAEFVEDQATIRRLQEIGVDYAQGYGIAMPGPLSDWLRTHPAGSGADLGLESVV
ncbi:putative bifunctional diguanylate cyclase/phosphodiesterase [Catenuloplanes atrovinosus]|uniref:Diguanylate cyclase (GGDEF)-like protein n=1 Tax=Catenuloplanes atrovinosus TaxID=137266 RepID=A0AAE3YPH8_9ACTN|nr:EAL domain-containing protein [Catenuloplanes atrovinosus]MDR7276181.1 diguanylate cyclase (GGDEF)-like protein [Catenuloplanes atrovinosus]